MANEKRLIDANALFAEAERIFCVNCNWYDGKCRECQYAEFADMLVDAPTVDAVSRGVLDQVRWEKDVAIKQLEEHGIPFGGIAPDVVKVVRCKDCNYFGGHGMCYCHAADEYGTPIFVREDDFCSYGERKDNG